MSRDLTASAETASLASHVRVTVLVKMEFTSGTLRVALSDRTITFGGFDYVGAGALGKISPIGETTDLSAEGIALEISGIPTTYVNLAMGEDIQGRLVTVYQAFLDANYALIDAPVVMFRGRMDVMDIRLGATATLSLRVENRLADWDRPRIRRYTHQDQIARFSADKGLEFVAQTTEREITWGRA